MDTPAATTPPAAPATTPAIESAPAKAAPVAHASNTPATHVPQSHPIAHPALASTEAITIANATTQVANDFAMKLRSGQIVIENSAVNISEDGKGGFYFSISGNAKPKPAAETPKAS